MRTWILLLAGLLAVTPSVVSAGEKEKGTKESAGVLNYKMKGLDGKEVDLSRLKGKVVVIVNVASRCGKTPQYAPLQKLYETHAKDGLVIVGVPANEFGKQEPGTDAQIAEFCESKYSVTFPMLSKVVVKGEGICPLYQTLTSKEENPKFGGPIKWNFTKFLINKQGEVVGRFEPGVEPDSPEMLKAIKAELAK